MCYLNSGLGWGGPFFAFDTHKNNTKCWSCAVGLAGEDKQAEVQAASTAAEMWKAIGKDSWVVVPIASTSRPGTKLSGAFHPLPVLHTHVQCHLLHCKACPHRLHSPTGTLQGAAKAVPHGFQVIPIYTARRCLAKLVAITFIP